MMNKAFRFKLVFVSNGLIQAPEQLELGFGPDAKYARSMHFCLLDTNNTRRIFVHRSCMPALGFVFEAVLRCSIDLCALIPTLNPTTSIHVIALVATGIWFRSFCWETASLCQ